MQKLITNSFKLLFLLSIITINNNASAHDPIFGIGPHVLFKDGIELHANISQGKKFTEKATKQAFSVKYGITGNWAVGIDLPYQQIDQNNETVNGLGDIKVNTKYRFWRNDSLAVQESAAVLLNIKLDSGNHNVSTNTIDTLVGFAYGYESLKWYRWSSIRYRFNQNLKQKSQIVERGNRLFIDFSIGYRAKVNGYRDPDMVYMLELNGEFSQNNKLNQVDIINTGDNKWFISPGFMWTLRNMAIKGGVQLPIYNQLDNAQTNNDYRVKLSVEWHL